MMDVRGLINESSRLLFKEGKYAEAIKKLHQAWDGITDKSTQILNQISITSFLKILSIINLTIHKKE